MKSRKARAIGVMLNILAWALIGFLSFRGLSWYQPRKVKRIVQTAPPAEKISPYIPKTTR
jgi:hypothetical protein